MQVIGDLGQHTFPVSLRGITAFPALPAELFEVVVQVSNSVLSLYLLSVSDTPGSLGYTGFA